MNIEELDLEVKTFNRLKKAGISTVGELLAEMYSTEQKVSQPDAKRCEAALKEHGIIRFMRGDNVTEDKIEPEPLTWDELHSCIGRLVVHDCSTESHRWLKVCWIYDIQDEGEGNLIYNDGSSSYGYVRRSSVNGEYASRRSPFLKYEGQFFALKTSEVPQEQSSNLIIESVEYTKAVKLHRCICANAQAAQESLYEMCKALKEMRDSRLYKELGYSELNDYCKSELGMSDRTAYKYISIAENFAADDNLVKSSSLIGREKLALLAKLDEQERTEIAQNTDLESTSVRELKAKIDDLKKANDRLMGKVEESEQKVAASRKSEEAACGKLSVLRTDYEMQQQKTMQLEAKLNAEAARSEELERQIEELESRPVDVTIESADVKALKEAHDKDIEALNSEHKKKLEQLKIKYEKQMKEGIEEAEKKAQEPDISGVWDVLYENFDLTAEQLTDFLEDNLGSSRTALYLERLKKRIREINTTVNDLLSRKEK